MEKLKNRVLEKTDDYVVLELAHGQKTIIDIDDYEKIKYFRIYPWYERKSKNYYCFIWIPQKQKEVRLHRFITNCPEGMVVDHKDRDTLNNRKSNLRVCTQQNNIWNCIGSVKTSKFKGVCKCKGKYKSKYFEAKIMENGKVVSLGQFVSEHNAAHAYNKAAVRIHGPFARLNENLEEENLKDEIIYNSKYKNNKTKYIGVNFHKQSGKYRARVKIDKKEISLGYFNSAIEAAKAYNDGAIRYSKNRKRRLKLNKIEEE